MATQGLVTVRLDGMVVMKILVGIDGDKVPIVAQAIRGLGRVPTVEEAYDFASDAGFSSDDTTVVTRENAHTFTGDSGLYQTTFNVANINPRWHHGTADHTEIVDV